MTSYYIYKITCTAGSFKDHYYIGQHKTDNLNDGYKGSGIKIQRYYKKYPNDYKKEILCFCVDEDDLNQKEDFYVGDLYETDPLCLNLVSGGMHRSCSDETRKKLSEVHKDKHPTNETRKKMSDTHKGKQLSTESRKKISESLSGRKFSDEHRKNISESGKGRQHTAESKQKMSEALKGRVFSEETRKKLSDAQKGKRHSEETRKKMSEALKGRVCSEETRKKLSDARNGKHHSEETLKKLSDAKKGENNPTYGCKWMNDGIQQKRVHTDEVNLYLDKGYSFGRLKINAI